MRFCNLLYCYWWLLIHIIPTPHSPTVHPLILQIPNAPFFYAPTLKINLWVNSLMKPLPFVTTLLWHLYLSLSFWLVAILNVYPNALCKQNLKAKACVLEAISSLATQIELMRHVTAAVKVVCLQG